MIEQRVYRVSGQFKCMKGNYNIEEFSYLIGASNAKSAESGAETHLTEEYGKLTYYNVTFIGVHEAIIIYENRKEET